MRRRDAGSVATEMAIIAPAIFLLLMLAIYAGRVTQTKHEVESAANAAARAASLRASVPEAAAAARDAARRNLADAHISCTPATVTIRHIDLQPGGTVTVQVQCTANLRDLGPLRGPATWSYSATATEVVDRFRGSV